MKSRFGKTSLAITAVLSFGIGVNASGKVIDLFDTIDEVRVTRSPLLQTWLRDPLTGSWKKIKQDDGSEIWGTEIDFPVHPSTRDVQVLYHARAIPARDPGTATEEVCFFLEVPEPEDLRYRVIFEQNRSLARETTFRRTDRAFFWMRARGSHALGIYPRAELFVDSFPVLSWEVDTFSWRIYTGSFVPPEGDAEVRLSFTNDGTNPKNGEDRNLHVDRGEILYPATLWIHLPRQMAQSYTTDGFEFRCVPDTEALLPALTRESFLTPYLIETEPCPARKVLEEVELNSISRRCLRLAAPSDLEWPLTLGSGKNVLRFAVTSEDFGGPGCTLQLHVSNGDEQIQVWERFVPPPRDRFESAWQDEEADLTRWQGKQITLRLLVEPGMPLHRPFERERPDEVSAGLLFTSPQLFTDEPAPDRTNVILISLDTVRADHLSCYGYERRTSPALDEFAADCVRFEYCVSAANMTLPSHGSIFTSLLSREHGAVNLPTQMREGSVTLAGVMREGGYRTVAFVDGGFLAPFYGFYQGFDLYNSQAGRSKNVFPRTMRWLERSGNLAPFFLFVHVYDAHTPYNGEAKDGGYRYLFDPHPTYSRIRELIDQAPTETMAKIENGQIPVNRHDVEHIVALYDAGIRLLDDRLRELFDFLESEGFVNNSLVVITSDHGEHFGERDYWMHSGPSMFREVLHVPLLIRFPGKEHAGLRINEPVSLLDLMPTLCDYAGLPVPDTCRGQSLLPLVHGTAIDGVRDLLSEAVTSQTMALTNREAKGIITYSSEPVVTELFDMRYDREERVNLVTEEPELAGKIRERLIPLLRTEVRTEEDVRGGLDPELAAQMEALGYIGR